MIKPVLSAFGNAVVAQLHYRMLLLTIAPFFISLIIWGLILYYGLQPMMDWLHGYFAANEYFRTINRMLGWLGSDFAAIVIVPLIAMWVLLPLLIVTALIFIGICAMPMIVKHVSQRNYPNLERRYGGHIWGSVWLSLGSFMIFVLLWIVSLPLSAIPPLGFIITPLLWGWLTYRVISYDALAEHADKDEYRTIRREHRWPMLLIGTLTGMMGAAPTLLWLGGVLSVVLFPFFAVASIWLYVLVFVFTGLWFEYYCLGALSKLRAGASPELGVVDVQFKELR